MAGNGLPIPGNGNGKLTPTPHDFASSFTASFRSSSPLAQELVARDLAECSDDGDAVGGGDGDESDFLDDDGSAGGPTLYRRPSGIAYGTARPALGARGLDEHPVLTPIERQQSRNAERSLLRDNHILPPKHRGTEHPGLLRVLYKRLFSTKVRRPAGIDEEIGASPALGSGAGAEAQTEASPLLGSRAAAAAGTADGAVEALNGAPQEEHLDEQWQAAVAAGQIKTTWQREAKTIATYSRSLIVTFSLQYFINVASVFAVGPIGKLELGAVSLATMSANISCYAVLQGLATCLDTLCSQAYGSGHKHLVGLQFQRMTCFLLLLLIPISVVWLNAEKILAHMVPEPRSAELAAQYLRITLLGTPAVVVFEGGKRFVNAQGLFHATTYVLLIASPLNAFMSWLFVWRLDWGFMGAPVAVVITQNLLPILLLLFVVFIDGRQCWGGFSRRAFTNWGPMIRLALPGMIMVVAEWLAFEILTLAAGQIGTSYLAAQSILVTSASLTFQLPFPVSVAGSTRVANLIGAGLIDAAKTSAVVTVVAGLVIGFFNLTVYSVFKHQIPLLFTQDQEVIDLVISVIPIVAVMQIFDSLSAVSHGLLRGIGFQEFGGYANLAAYYIVALPISFGTCFGLGWDLDGLWTGVTIGLVLVTSVELLYMYRSDWERAAKEAESRNASG